MPLGNVVSSQTGLPSVTCLGSMAMLRWGVSGTFKEPRGPLSFLGVSTKIKEIYSVYCGAAFRVARCQDERFSQLFKVLRETFSLGISGRD